MPNIDLSILNQRQTPAFYADVFANRPAAGFVGRIFVSTDTFAFYRDNGTGWDLIGGPGTGTITGTGTANTFTIFTGASTIGNSSYLTQAANAINVASANINLPANNTVGGTNYYIGQIMADNDYWKIYGNTPNSDDGELVFEIGDNGLSSHLDRFRFYFNDASIGVDKNALTIDFDESVYNTNLIVSTGYNLGVGVSVPSGLIHADGGASAARMIIDADNGIARIFSFRTDNLPRWALRVDGTETGSNVGGDFSVRRYDDTGAFVDAPLSITRSTGQSTFAKKVVIENNAGDQQLQIVSTSAPSLRFDNLQTGATKRAGLGISTATNNFIQGSADRDFCMFNGSTTASPILFGIYDAGAVNVQEAARISAARNFLVGTTTDAGQKLQVNGTAYISGISSFGSNINVEGNCQIKSNNVLQLFNSDNTNGFQIYNSGATGSTNANLIFLSGNVGERMRLDASGNLGLGVTPSAWASLRKAIELGKVGASLSSGVNVTEISISANAYDGTGGWTYANTGATTLYQQNSGSHVWYYGASGTAGNAISFTQAMTLASTGNLLIGTTTDAGQKLQVAGTLNLWGNNSIQTISKTFVSGGSVSFIMSSEYGFNLADNVNGLVIVSISDTTSTSFGLSGVYVGQVINPRGTVGTITLISTNSGANLNTLTVTMSGNNIVVSATSATYPTNTLRASFTFIGGGGTN